MRLRDLLRTRLIDPIRLAQGSPESIARGGALGMWVALTPTVGIQMLMVLVLSVPLRANLPVGLALCWITNPVTLVPFYFGFYWLGALLLGRAPAGFSEVAGHLRDAFGAGEGLQQALVVLGGEILWPMLVGSLVIASACAVPTYVLAKWVFLRREGRLAANARAGNGAAAASPVPPAKPATPVTPVTPVKPVTPVTNGPRDDA